MPIYPYMYYGTDIYYLGIVVLSLLLGFLTQSYIKRTYAKWSHVPSKTAQTGKEAAQDMLAQNGVDGVAFVHINGELTDNYNPATKVMSLSSDNMSGGSVASIAVACHECGHAVQDAKGYIPGKLRTALVPAVNIAQSAWSVIMLLGFMFSMMSMVYIGIALFAVSVVFQLVTLPVEIDASKRALAYLKSSGHVVDERGAREVLTAAALTYVAAALISIVNLLYLLARANNSRR